MNSADLCKLFNLPTESIPDFQKALAPRDPASDFAPLYDLIDLLPNLKSQYQAHAIDDSVFKATMGDVGIWLQAHHRATGKWGFSERSWLNNHFNFKIFRLGRLQFMPLESQIPALLYTNGSAYTLMAPDGFDYRADGQAQGTCGIVDPSGFTSYVKQTAEGTKGFAIDRRGAVQSTPTTLNHSWTLVCAPKTPVLDVHIPEGEPLDIDACLASFQFAISFFATHFPEKKFAAFSGNSWLLGQPLIDALPPQLNLPRFQQLFYIAPLQDGMEPTIERVFGHGHRPASAQEAPANTTLQRAVRDLWLQQKEFYGAGGLIPIKNDVPQYRKLT